MTVTNEFERDLNDTSFLGRPGRVDMRVFQNTANAGDGYPGLQRAFRNYLHEGGIEKDIQLLGFSIKGDSVNINNAEMQELSNIGTVTINGTQWGYVGGADQPVKIGDSPTFSGLTLSANLVTTSTIDSVNISTFKTDYDTHKGSTGVDHSYIDQSVIITTSPTFAGLTINGNITITGTVDGVDVGGHVGSSANPHTVTAQQGFTANNTVSVSTIKFTGSQVNIGEWGTLTLNSSGLIDPNATIHMASFGTLQVDSALYVKTGGQTTRWAWDSSGNFYPWSANTYNLGSTTNEIKTLWYCSVQDTTCAYLGDYSYEDLYGLYAQIKPMEDGGLHYSDHNKQYFPHIDFKTLPKEFSTPANKDMVKENVWELNKKGKVVKRKINYKKGDTIAIDAGNYLYGLGNLVVKMGEKIKELELEIDVLKTK